MAIRLSFLIARFIGQWHASKTKCQFRLTHLPNELIALICEHVASPKDLRRLASTCSRVQALAEPVLYRRIEIRDRPIAEHVLGSFEIRPKRSFALHYVDVPCKPRVGPDLTAIVGLFVEARNIREIMFESPECNSNNWEREEEWVEWTDLLFAPFQLAAALSPPPGRSLRDRPLQKLTKLTLNMNGKISPYWSLDERSICLFHHPSLQELNISCVNINKYFPPADELKHSTPLKRLTLIECNINTKGLSGILQLPNALEHLYLGENCHNIRIFPEDVDPATNHLFERNSAATLLALSHQKDSLKSLSYATTPIYYQNRQLLFAARCTPPVNGGFAGFHQLEHVHLIGHCPNFERCVMSSTAPPSLRSLHLQESFDIPPEFRNDCATTAPFLRVPSVHVTPQLKSLDVTIDAIYSHRDIQLSDLVRHQIIEAHSKCRKMGVELKVYYKRHTEWIPPFLYGEEEAESELIYEGNDVFLGRFAWEDIPTDAEESDSEYVYSTTDSEG